MNFGEYKNKKKKKKEEEGRRKKKERKKEVSFVTTELREIIFNSKVRSLQPTAEQFLAAYNILC